MSDRKIIRIVEMDVDTCTRRFGESPCTAALSLDVQNKCYNTRGTCADPANYDRSFVTLRFCESTYPLRNGNYMPLIKSVGGYEQTVNIAGYDSGLGGIGTLGGRARIKISMADMPDRGVLLDPYWDERMSGDAQLDGIGYDPMDRSSFWAKLKARSPNYADRPLRIIHAYIDDTGSVVPVKTMHYVVEDISGPDPQKGVDITVKDILTLADDKKALAPRLSKGSLAADMTNSQTTLTLSSGAEYPASGYIVIGSEIMSFTRSADTMFVQRGQMNTGASSHSTGDTVQLCFNVDQERADSVIYKLLTEYGNISPSWINFAEWQAEFNVWGNNLLLSATICKPTGVSTLVGEINQLGIAVWWDEINQKIRVKLNRPPTDEVSEWSDRANLMSFSQSDNDELRITQVEFRHMQINPTRELSDDNFIRAAATVSVAAESPDMYGIQRVKQIKSRWLNYGADAVVRIVSQRILSRFSKAPSTYQVVVDVRDMPELTDVISVNSRWVTDVNGKPIDLLCQVISRADDKLGSTIKVKLERFQFDERYGSVTPNDMPVYQLATAAQKAKYAFIAPNGGRFGDGAGAYRFI